MEFLEQILEFRPQTMEEEDTKHRLLTDIEQYGERILCRENQGVHMTVGSMILDTEYRRTLMAYHRIYQSFAWTGGHCDGEGDLLSVALREAKEETGIGEVWPVTQKILGLYRLPVPQHRKNGRTVPGHIHYVAAFGLLAPEKQNLRVKKKENEAVSFFSVEDMEQVCTEPHMLPVYRQLLKRMLALRQKKQDGFSQLPRRLVPWYTEHARLLPWRRDREPYHVWLSEIMLQQTRVEAVKGYYERFLQELPTIGSLAQAPEDRLLKLWEGLGYYTRVRNLQKAAKQIIQMHQGIFPREYADIRALPGIGDYTAGAIASICFEEPEPAVDGNVLRVISRITEDFTPLHRPELKKGITKALRKVYPKGECGLFTQALMELGATVCLPNGAPACAVCPVQDICMTSGRQTALSLPVKKQKKPRRIEERTVFVACCGNQYAVCRRRNTGLLAGCWQFPNTEKKLTAEEAMQTARQWGLQPSELLRTVDRVHIFSHVEWHMRGVYFLCRETPETFQWVTPEEIETEISLPTAFRMFWQEAI